MNAANIEFLSTEVLLWMLPCVLASVGIGVIIGRGYALRHLSARIRKERQEIVDALQKLLNSTEQLSSDVGSHGTELASMERSVHTIHAAGDLQQVQQALLYQISDMLASNRKMEDDLIVTHFQLEAQAQELDRTRIEARTDELSGLSNRKSFDEFSQFVLSQHNRKGTPFSLILADVDHFKRINDTHGHVAGDRIVARLGETLKQLTRERDHVARIGGDEFAIILVGIDVENCRIAASRIRAAVERTNFDVGEQGARVAVTLSMGMAFPDANDTCTSIFQRADKALYRSKESGRNQLHVWAPQPECDFRENSKSLEAQTSS